MRRTLSSFFSHTRVALLLACLIVLGMALAGCGSIASPTALHGSNSPATPTQRPSYIYVAIGASETFGTGADNPATESYPEDMKASLPAGAQVIDLGVPGITAPEAVRGELPEALDAHPNLVTVWLGTNDIIQKVTLADFQQSLDSILSQLASGTHARVAVVNLPDLTYLPRFYSYDQATLKAQVQQWNAVIAREASAHHDILIDMYGHSSEVLGHPEYLSGDGLHPSTLGYLQIANLFYQVLHSNGVI
jgi:lysophospholipase L1-like esterase